jgi:hypothetical protein
MRFLWRLLAAFFVITAALCYSDIAHAQSIAIVNEASLPRLDKAGQVVQKRSLTLSPEAVNLQDCVDDQQIRFTLQMAGFEVNAVVQAWASNSGADCKVETARSGGVQTCWRAYPTDIPLQTTIDVNIPVRNIMQGAPPFSAQKPDNSPAACGQVNLSTISVHFLYFAAGNTSLAAQAKTIGVTIDTVGPKPPSGLTALPGNTRIQVQWTNISGGNPDSSTGGGLTELTGVKVYCDPAGAPVTTTVQNPEKCTDELIDGSIDDSGDAAIDGSLTAEVCVDGGTTQQTSSAGCASPNFVKSDGTALFPTADFNAKYECGSITGNTGTTVVASSVGKNALANGTTYAVAVAATDKFGNVGELSPVICAKPEITTDFWDDYKKAGGEAGGGCAATSSESTTPIGSLAVLGVVGIVVAKSVKKRRSKNKDANK